MRAPLSGRSPPLPTAVAAELARLEMRLGQAADPGARSRLAELDDAAAAWVIRRIAEPRRPVRNLSGYIRWMVEKDTLQRNAAGVPTAESAACFSAPFRASQQGSFTSPRPVLACFAFSCSRTHHARYFGAHSARLPNHVLICQTEDSVSGPFYADHIQMEVQSPGTDMAFGLSNQARIEPVSPDHQMHRFQYHENPLRTNACMIEMEVQSPPCFISPGLQNQSHFSPVASPMAYCGRTGAGCIEHRMPEPPPRDFIPSPVRNITRRVQQMNVLSGRAEVAAPPSFDHVNSLRAKASPQMLALGELEFDRFFLIQVYLAE
ncbi:hypothetical protein PR202_ga23153 [Eleusine coracana subsp. coracana]|uniref:RDRP3-5 N-terminal domain-containing protein n=1 Tax=Eleusine coracana subsp. coracana TaxID=191504 RepID=A0AAV5D526_ELECO|nr:hypothetical protein PR202_ga23153 [Eleusine coracana subsp. coracana]